jgi:cob(I)alamin adenosyltransferase
MPSEFVVPGQNRIAALLDVARTVVRRGERLVVGAMADVDSQVGPYLNRLSDLLWTIARWQEGEHLLSRHQANEHEENTSP